MRNTSSSDIDWSAIKGMRNIVVHNYGHIDLEILWSAATEDIPILKAFCEKHISDI